jgi:hypothetical protein
MRLVSSALVAALLAAAAGPAQAGLKISFVPGSNLSGRPEALAALDRAAAQWESRFSDPITVRVEVDLAPLPAGVLGSSEAVLIEGPFDQACRRMIADAYDEPDDGVVAFLPSARQFSASLPPGIRLGGELLITMANAKAIGLPGLDFFGHSDGAITFNSDVAFDFDNRDGVGPDEFDFETVAAHEIGHILGFISQVDAVDALLAANRIGAITPTALDLFRFQTDLAGADPRSGEQFRILSRFLGTGGDAVISDVLLGFPVSTGEATGDGRGAAHWKDDLLTGDYVGLMDPTLPRGQVRTLTDADLRALDLVGYDVILGQGIPFPEVPEPGTLSLLGLGVAVLLLRRRRPRAA